MHVINVNNLTKVYKARKRTADVLALNNFSLQVEEGKIFGLLGPNGAGKTTFIKILLGITHPTSGTAEMLGKPIQNYTIKARIGYLPENHRYPGYLNAEQILIYFSKLSGYYPSDLNSRINFLLHLVKMEKWKRVKIKKYSKGMMQRLGLALSMINDPDVIFLDEPTDGVDPIGRKEIRDVLVNLKNEGKTIFLNSHLLSEVELISDEVAILHKGNLVQRGSVQELTTTKEIYEITLDKALVMESINAINETGIIERHGNKYTIKVATNEELNRIIDELRQNGYYFQSIVPKKHSLEEMFINLINDKEKNAS
ncbi:MAG: ABC transporter ATP-binding protein [Melioribacteraceae bacterium]|nr:ABC transporter ATP-binding protein [Melioribacteraceae bacterium]